MYKGKKTKKKKTRNLLLELTGVTTINIIGTTIHISLVINICVLKSILPVINSGKIYEITFQRGGF